jgi:hypothetical protein
VDKTLYLVELAEQVVDRTTASRYFPFRCWHCSADLHARRTLSCVATCSAWLRNSSAYSNTSLEDSRPSVKKQSNVHVPRRIEEYLEILLFHHPHILSPALFRPPIASLTDRNSCVAWRCDLAKTALSWRWKVESANVSKFWKQKWGWKANRSCFSKNYRTFATHVYQ